MSVKGKKVLHIDRNDHYGGYVFALAQRFGIVSDETDSEAASINIEAVSLPQRSICSCTHAEYSSSRNMATIAKERSPGRSMGGSTTGTLTLSQSF